LADYTYYPVFPNPEDSFLWYGGDVEPHKVIYETYSMGGEGYPAVSFSPHLNQMCISTLICSINPVLT
jgi:hypothetical protein